MDFIANAKVQVEEILEALGIDDVEALFSEIPQQLLVPRPSLDDGLSEQEGMVLMETLAAKNTFCQYDNYLGGGAYEHHIPALAGAVTAKSEFLTAYTPYQAEASQGMLQAIFEFQSAVCALTGLDVANASVYDGGSACAEAVLMALRTKKGRNKILIGQSLHPHYRGVVDQYLDNLVRKGKVIVETVPFDEKGQISCKAIEEHLDDTVAALLLQYPSFLGTIDDVSVAFTAARDKGAINIVCANPIAYGLYRSAAELEADIAVGDLQPLGMPLQYGGPYVGYMACNKTLMRQLPGRLVGETVDTEGKRGFVLALQAREQHIRRDKATSNICSNQNLAALSSLVTMLWYGPEGLHHLALTNYQRAAYLQKGLTDIDGVEALSDAPIFNEFAIKISGDVKQVIAGFKEKGIIAGLPLGCYYKGMEQCLLIAVTETKTKQQLDKFLEVAVEILK